MVIEFEFETEYGTFRDALHFSDDAVPDVDEIERLKEMHFEIDQKALPVLKSSPRCSLEKLQWLS